MPCNATGIGLVCWLLAAGIAPTEGAPNAAVSSKLPERPEMLEGRSIDCGFVIVEGEYLPLPYVVSKRGEDLFINEHLVPLRASAPGPGDRGGPGPGDRRGGPRPGDRRGGPRPGDRGGEPGRFRRSQPRPWQDGDGLARIERNLEANMLLIVLDDETAGWLEPYKAILTLDVLLSDSSDADKVDSLVAAGIPWIGSPEWAAVAQSFDGTTELDERVRPVAERFRTRRAEDEAQSQHLMSRSFLSSPPARYTATLVAMGLVVIAFGNLLSHHPERGARWRDVDRNGDGVGMVKRNVILLVCLGVFDLACTSLAEQAGGFLELNPLGGPLTQDPIALAAFKMTTLALACGILLGLRRYRGAQAASWWMCLVVTVVALRWLTYNSMFLT